MSFFDKLKNIVTDTDEDDFDDYYDDNTDELTKPAQRYDAEPSFSAPQPQQSFDRFEREERQERPMRRAKSDKVVNIHTTAQLQVVLVKPETFEEAKAIADNLSERRTVVLNLESANREIARRLLDFLVGAAYISNGKVKRVANSTYIITPYNVDIMGDLIDELENSGMFM